MINASAKLAPVRRDDLSGGFHPTKKIHIRSLVVLPTYNESENLPHLIPSLLSKDPSIEVLVIDDASTDGTGKIAEDFAQETDRVRVLHREGKLGVATAYVAGFKHALKYGYDYVIHMDADFSHRPEDVPHLLQAAESADVIIGSRFVTGSQVGNRSLVRRFVSKGGSFYARYLLNLPIRDCLAGFKCFRREVLETVDFESIGSIVYTFQVEMNYLCRRAGFRIVEVPIVFPDRVAGNSKLSTARFLKASLEASRLFWKLRARSVLPRSRSSQPISQPVSGSEQRT